MMNKYKDLIKEIEKMWHLKTNTILIKGGGALDMIKKETLARYPAVPVNMKYKKLHFSELLISVGEYYQYHWKISPKIGCKKHEYVECI